MCGIVGYSLSKENAIPLILESLNHLEYRGYDSAGISFLQNGDIVTKKVSGRVLDLQKELTPLMDANIAIGHTRWSTHGKSTTENAHPHTVDNVSIVHNGIIENYFEIKQNLQKQGATFKSETDSEVVAHFLNNQITQNINPIEAIKQAMQTFSGKYAIAFIMKDIEKIYVFRSSGSPIVFGILENGFMIASDLNTLSSHTNKFITIEDNEILEFSSSEYQFFDKNTKNISKQIITQNIPKQDISKNGFETFMMKEIHEQPAVIKNILQNLTDGKISTIGLSLKDFSYIHIVACGTSFFAGSFAKYIIEEHQNIPVSVEIASEFSYRRQPFLPKTLFIFASQSGETADSIAAMEHTIANKTTCSKILSILNNTQSTMAKKSDFVIPCYAGIEIGVASTKNFIAQLVIFYLLAFQKTEKESYIVDELQLISQEIVNVLNNIDYQESIKSIAEKIINAKKIVFTGRTLLFPIACEGSLKLSELSYINVQAIASGEFKHGPIAIVDDSTILVSITHSKNMFQKTLLSNEEVITRNGTVCLIADRSALYQNEIIIKDAENFTYTFPILLTIAIQNLAYSVAKILGNDIDKPRNLAKSVTVE